jgi:hypothetical protein
VRCSIPSCTNLDNYINTAGALLGWTVKDINEGLTAETVKDAWTQVVANHPDAVATAGFPEVLFSSELAQLKADNIPVVDMSVADPVGNGITAVFDGNSTNDEAGVLQANWAIATEGTKADTFTIGVPTFPTITDVVNSFTKTYKQLCPACLLSDGPPERQHHRDVRLGRGDRIAIGAGQRWPPSQDHRARYEPVGVQLHRQG